MSNFDFDFGLRLKKHGRENPRKFGNGIFGCMDIRLHTPRARSVVLFRGTCELGDMKGREDEQKSNHILCRYVTLDRLNSVWFLSWQ